MTRASNAFHNIEPVRVELPTVILAPPDCIDCVETEHRESAERSECLEVNGSLSTGAEEYSIAGSVR